MLRFVIAVFLAVATSLHAQTPFHYRIVTSTHAYSNGAKDNFKGVASLLRWPEHYTCCCAFSGFMSIVLSWVLTLPCAHSWEESVTG